MKYAKKLTRHLYLLTSPFRKNWTEQEQRMLRFYSTFVKKGDWCFDIGANIGNRSRIFLELGAKVVAVEPQEGCVSELRKLRSRRLHVIQKVLGPSEGTTELLVADASVLSTLSTDWMNAVRQSGRFSTRVWERKQRVEMTTLDALIKKFGMPVFIKIDVEGFELEVLKGLSRPVPALSFEFTPEVIDSAIGCIHYLTSLNGKALFNYSINESMEMVFSEWAPAQDVVSALRMRENNIKIFGDVYVKFPH
jgi:FkbM family methyltransferase